MSFKKMLALLMSVLSIAACTLPFSGCGKTVGKVHNKDAKSGAVRNLTENISKNDSDSKAADKEFKAAAASFSADLFKYNSRLAAVRADCARARAKRRRG